MDFTAPGDGGRAGTGSGKDNRRRDERVFVPDHHGQDV